MGHEYAEVQLTSGEGPMEAAMNIPSKRQRFRISLRTLFVLVTVFSLLLSWQFSIVRHRQSLLAALADQVGVQVIPADLWAKSHTGRNFGQPPARVSPVRRLLGDRAIQEIWYSWNSPLSPGEVASLREAFPEALIRETVPEPCHPGCFPAGTLVDTPAGLRCIETVGIGELVKTYGQQPSTAVVQGVFVTDNRLWRIDTEAGALIATQTQPLVLCDQEVVQAGKLHQGDKLLRWSDGGLKAVVVLQVRPTDRTEKVYNLILGNSEIMLANGFLCCSKPSALAEVD